MLYIHKKIRAVAALKLSFLNICTVTANLQVISGRPRLVKSTVYYSEVYATELTNTIAVNTRYHST